jgi:hypothetical protein
VEAESAVNQDIYIRVRPHHCSGLPAYDTRYKRTQTILPTSPHDTIPPYAPFSSIQDFIFAQSRIQRNHSDHEINFDLESMRNGTFATGCTLSFDNAAEMRKLVDQAAEIYQKVSYLSTLLTCIDLLGVQAS